MGPADYNRKRATVDKAVALLVRLGGIGVVLAVFFIAAFLVMEAAPLAAGPAVASRGVLVEAGRALAAGVEPFAEASWSLRQDGHLQLRDLRDGELIEDRELFRLREDERVAAVRVAADQGSLAIATTAGRLAAAPLGFVVDYGDELERSHRLEGTAPRWLIEEGAGPLSAFDHQVDGPTVWAVAAAADGAVELIRGKLKIDKLSGEERISFRKLVLEPQGEVRDLALLASGAFVAGFADGSVRAWQASRDFKALEERGAGAPGAPILQIRALIGSGSALVARDDGSVERWMLKLQESGHPVLGQAAAMPERLPGLRGVVPSSRQRLFFALGQDEVWIGQATAGEYLARIPLPARVRGLAVAPREDHLLLLAEDGSLELRAIDLGFPAVTAHTLFGKVLYEGAAEPAWTWQSTGGTDAYEPKTSFVPLILGTLKGTFWALLPSIPLALLGALFTARFLRGRAREIVKPAVELLAGIPSVILGFVAALYLAPAIQDRMLSIMLLPIALVLVTVALASVWARLPLRKRRILHEGLAPFVLAGVYFGIAWAVIGAGPWIEQTLFGTSLRMWLPEGLGLPFEQRNAAVVGLAMGFTVTPLIFTLAEDAFRNVPETLAEASQALGATPWQTAVRVIVPPAMPGVVAAVMLGLGRAVGETMIVLMATGNTPITGMNLFQGFRALSANLAVELPEAPHGGSLYRTLFLSALMLFAFTFVINTLAEVVRVRGRKAL